MSFIRSQEEKRANLVMQIREVIDSAEAESRGLDASELEKINRIEADINDVSESLAVAQRSEERHAQAAAVAQDYVPATESRSENEILRHIAETRGSHEFESRATMVPTDVPEKTTFFDQVFDIARLVGPMLDVGQRFNTTSGEDITYPTLTVYSDATLTAPGIAFTDSEPTYDSIILGAYKYGLLIPVANELITDAGFDITSHLAQQAGQGIGFKVNNVLTLGTGTNQPTGVLTAAGSGVTGGTGLDGAFTADDLIDLQYTLDGAARRLPGVAYMANTQTIGAMRKLKDDDNRYLFDVNVGQPQSFAGYEIVENPAMPAIADEAKSVLFGHLPSFLVRTVGGVQVATSTDFAFNQDVTTFRVMIRVDGNLTHASHIKSFAGGAAS